MSEPRTRCPNVLIVIADDLAYGDLGCHGNEHVRTPYLDALHGRSVRLTRYCSGPLCTPARASLMTGRHHLRTAAIDTYLGRATLHPDEITLPQLLSGAGYATGLFGKWHLGDHYPSRPEDRGFDETLWHGSGGIGQPGDRPANTYFNPTLRRNGGIAETRGYCTDVFVDAACAFVERHHDRPWFCYLATNAPHTPLQVPDAWVASLREQGLPETWARLYAMVENLDAGVGRLMALLQSLGLLDDTLIVFTSDHGPCPSADHQGEIRFNAGLRGRKASLYEGGVRVPCFLSYPRAFDGGREVDRLACPMDLLPTLAPWCGYAVPQGRTMDGMDLTALLTGEADGEHWPDRHVIMQWHRGDTPRRWLNAAVLTQKYKLYRPGSHDDQEPAARPLELYDLSEDMGETSDLADHHPDVVEALATCYEQWFDQLTAERGDATWSPVPIHLGHESEPVVELTRQDWRLYPGSREGRLWNAHDPGNWPVSIDRAGPFVVQVVLPREAAGRCTLNLRCGAWAVTRAVDPTLSGYVELIGPEELPLGNHVFESWVDFEGQRLGVERVVVSLNV